MRTPGIALDAQPDRCPRSVARLRVPVAALLTAVLALIPGVAALPVAAPAAAQTDSATAAGFTTTPRPTADPPADRSQPTVLRVQHVTERKVIADVWSPAMDRAIPTFVLVPPGGGPSPLLMLLNGVGGGEDHVGWAYHTDYENFFADKNVLVASPEGGRFSLYADWQQPDPVLGVNMWQTFLDHELPAALAGTWALNGTRGVIGVSMSGGPALTLAARNPQRYAAAASLSGLPEVSTPFGRTAMAAMVARGAGNVFNAFGHPGDPAWLVNDPAHDVNRLRGTEIYLSSAPGTPGPGEPVSSATPIGATTEALSDLGTRHMARQLSAAGIPHTFDRLPAGAHTFELFERQLHRSWNVVGPALGA